MYKDYLMHYGVLGMKWGVRKNHSKPINSLLKKKHTERKNRMEQKI